MKRVLAFPEVVREPTVEVHHLRMLMQHQGQWGYFGFAKLVSMS